MHRPPDPRFESPVEKQIREAVERGEFDDLPGKGKPLPGAGTIGPIDEDWWVRGYLRREGLSTDALLPTSLQLRKQIDKLPETLRPLRDERWVRDHVSELNRQVVEYMRHPSGPRVPIRKLDPDEIVAAWRADRRAQEAADAVPAPRPEPEPGAARRPWWSRLLRRR
ncbi:MAG: DUF1992 domain-containing protein [Actinomycetota bacterium]|nr:DUF1992 domain-containing protein [Actinomycetota bacterium]